MIMCQNEIEMINSAHTDREDSKKFGYAMIPLLGLIPFVFIIPLLG